MIYSDTRMRKTNCFNYYVFNIYKLMKQKQQH